MLSENKWKNLTLNFLDIWYYVQPQGVHHSPGYLVHLFSWSQEHTLLAHPVHQLAMPTFHLTVCYSVFFNTQFLFFCDSCVLVFVNQVYFSHLFVSQGRNLPKVWLQFFLFFYHISYKSFPRLCKHCYHINVINKGVIHHIELIRLMWVAKVINFKSVQDLVISNSLTNHFLQLFIFHFFWNRN